ncbi:MAG: hypothetical protein C4560_08590 [Nitrospiraceae bacterium]|nr:MAG: hypothetical protein C4560_08590 [Nitrospiraceae bacterium]
MKKIGFLYIAFGIKYIKEAIFSAKSLRKFHPDASITIITDRQIDSDLFSKEVIKPSNKSYVDKIKYMRESPYEKTMFLDTDTYICDKIGSVFGLLKYFDVCMATEIGRPLFKDLPEGFEDHKEFNTGVILFNNNSKVQKLFELWEKTFETRKHLDSHDQPSMAIALAYSDVKFGVLPNEYNVRAIYPEVLSREVTIIHARLRDYQKTLKKLNKNSDMARNWLPASMECIPIYGNALTKLWLGIKSVLSPAVNKVRSKLGLQGDLILPGKGRFEE